MTPALEAGRECDARIEERIFGNPVQRDPEKAAGRVANVDPSTGGERHADDGPWVSVVRPSGVPLSWPIPHYSTSIADAWKVVEKMRKDGHWFSLCSLVDSQPDEWRAEIRIIDDFAAPIVKAAPTAPHAICLAALAASRNAVTP